METLAPVLCRRRIGQRLTLSRLTLFPVAELLDKELILVDDGVQPISNAFSSDKRIRY